MDSGSFFVEGKNLPKRNNFRSLLGLLEQDGARQLSMEEKEMIISIRNAFSHNSYNVNLHEANTQKKIELPKVADLILNLMDGYRNKVLGIGK